MANRECGEVELFVGHVEYTLRFSVGAIVELEGRYGGSLHEAVQAAAGAQPRLSLIRLLLWAALRDRHQLTVEAAGGVLSIAGPAAVLAKLNAAIGAAFPKRSASSDAGDGNQADWNDLLRLWMTKTGQPRGAFWSSTPSEISLDLDVAAARSVEANQTLRWHTWHIAALPKSKKFPSFRDFVRPAEAEASPRARQNKQPQPADGQLAAIRQFFEGRRRQKNR